MLSFGPSILWLRSFRFFGYAPFDCAQGKQEKLCSGQASLRSSEWEIGDSLD